VRKLNRTNVRELDPTQLQSSVLSCPVELMLIAQEPPVSSANLALLEFLGPIKTWAG